MARLGRAGCRSGRGRGIPEDTLRNFMFNVLAAVLILEFLSGINLIVQTSALEIVAPAMPPFQGWRPFHYLASQAEVLVSVSAQPADGHQRQKKLYSSAVAMSSAHPPISAPSYSSMPGALDLAIYSSDLSHPPVQHTRRLATAAPARVDVDPPDAASNSSAAPSGLVQPPVSPHNGCCAPNMVQKRGTRDCHCVYPVRIELFLRNVSLTSNWSNEFLQELASQLNLRVNQFEIVNFYVVGASGLNITMDIAPHTGISFAADQVKAMNYSLTLHTVRIDPVLVGDYNLLNLTWFRPLAPAPVPAIGNTTPGTNVTVYPQPPLPPPAAPPAAIIPSVPAQEQRGPKSKLWIIGIAIPLLAILPCSTFTFLWMRRRKKGMLSSQNRAGANRIEENALVWRIEEKSSEFTLFDLSQLLEATENFANRLGQGGFGPVYKGQLSDGQEIAVKRLASHSGQGFTEFRNEVELIAKLQHTNLVWLLGCCIQGEEKILVYEYLPNKSLDFFIFDESQSSLLNWYKRRAIIEGVAQGLLYLHKHSRLRVVHRDLKASNILLDQDMNPKISDFGLARIFSSNDTEGSTKRVVGTYGYMSPEYASEGIYSVKSDVFSFGVLLLEILSAKRNSGFHRYGEFLNLLGYTWHLWEEGRWLDLVEASISKEMHEAEARRYINIALMCVQENADDRPTMSDVVAALNSESVVLPEPKHPAYFNLRVSKSVESAIVVETCSLNDVTITQDPQGR